MGLYFLEPGASLRPSRIIYDRAGSAFALAAPDSFDWPALLSGGSVLPIYFIAGFIAPEKPREFALADAEERQFWQRVRASPAQSARDIRSRMKDIDRRIADIESYVTTENRSLAREIEQLR